MFTFPMQERIMDQRLSGLSGLSGIAVRRFRFPSVVFASTVILKFQR